MTNLLTPEERAAIEARYEEIENYGGMMMPHQGTEAHDDRGTLIEENRVLRERLEAVMSGPTAEQIQAAKPYLNTESETNIWAAFQAMLDKALLKGG